MRYTHETTDANGWSVTVELETYPDARHITLVTRAKGPDSPEHYSSIPLSISGACKLAAALIYAAAQNERKEIK